MKTPTTLLLAGTLALLLAACGSSPASPAPSAAPSSPSAVTPAPSDAAPPDEPVSGEPGIVPPGEPGMGAPQMVQPVAGVQNPQDVRASKLTAAVNGRNVAVRIEWTSGVEPCHSLAGVEVQRDGNEFLLTVREGTTDPNAMCIEIAQLKATDVDLGELEPGTYTIGAFGDASPIDVVVS